MRGRAQTGFCGPEAPSAACAYARTARDTVIMVKRIHGFGAERMRIGLGDNKKDMRAVWFSNGTVKMIDQRKFPDDPQKLPRVRSFRNYEDVASAIKDMTVRGAPSIGAAAAYGMCLASLSGADVRTAAEVLKATRPTAHDLFCAVDRMLLCIGKKADPVRAADDYAQKIVDECVRIGEHGAELIEDNANIMTHCNAGALATVDVGTALAPIRKAHADGKNIHVYVSETRPRLQGIQTAWELRQEGIPHTLIVDGASGHFMKTGVDIVIVGADRIAANGDFANKIGTYEKAVIAKELGIPFYAAAPDTTFDPGTPDGSGIVIEDRGEDEVTTICGVRKVPRGTPVSNPSFDVTPAKYVTGFITGDGILAPSKVKDHMRKIGRRR